MMANDDQLPIADGPIGYSIYSTIDINMLLICCFPTHVITRNSHKYRHHLFRNTFHTHITLHPVITCNDTKKHENHIGNTVRAATQLDPSGTTSERC